MSTHPSAAESVDPSTVGRLSRPERPERRGRVTIAGGARVEPLVAAAFAWVGLLLILAVTASWLPLHDPDVATGMSRIGAFADWSHPLGTDDLGRDMLSRVIFGIRTSLSIGLMAVAVGFVLGGWVGVVVGFFRGKVDASVGVLVDAWLAFPGLVLLLAIGAIMGPGLTTVVVGLSALAVPLFVRIARANALQVADREFVQAARLVGASSGRVIRREIIPNVIPPMIAYAVVLMGTMISAETALSYLGVGVSPPTSSWGQMIADGQFSIAEYPHLVFVPTAVLALTIYAFSVIGDWARGRFDTGQAKV